jgi:hypothetical protein
MAYWTDIRQWIAEEDALIRRGYDSITVYTGEEGTGKSYAMLVRQNLADPTFFRPGAWSEGWEPKLPTDRVVFNEGHAERLAVTLPPGSALQVDELDAHKRGAMTRQRRQFLKVLKEKRKLGLRWALGFPHIDQLDKDILRSRVRYRAHQDVRGLLVVKSRVKVREEVDKWGNPRHVIRWDVRGRFPIPDVSGYPITKAYEKKKDAFTHRREFADEEAAEDFAPRLFDREAAMPVMEELRAALALPPNQAFYAQVLDDIKQAQ